MDGATLLLNSNRKKEETSERERELCIRVGSECQREWIFKERNRLTSQICAHLLFFFIISPCVPYLLGNNSFGIAFCTSLSFFFDPISFQVDMFAFSSVSLCCAAVCA